MVVTPAWADFDQLVEDLSRWEEHAKPGDALLLVKVIAYLYWQRTVIEEVKGEVATLEAMLRAR
jgi:hypothetical protein